MRSIDKNTPYLCVKNGKAETAKGIGVTYLNRSSSSSRHAQLRTITKHTQRLKKFIAKGVANFPILTVVSRLRKAVTRSPAPSLPKGITLIFQSLDVNFKKCKCKTIENWNSTHKFYNSISLYACTRSFNSLSTHIFANLNYKRSLKNWQNNGLNDKL